MSYNISKITYILNKHQGSRSPEDIREISSLISNIKFFESLKDNKHIFNECCAYLSYESFSKDQYFFHIGDTGDKFYILIQGEASVLIPIKDNKASMKEIHVFSDGASFGEAALIEKKPRNATIQAKTVCHVAVLDKFNYQRILSSIMKQKQMELVHFLQEHPPFNQLTKGSLIRLSYCFEEKAYTKNQRIYAQGDPAKFLYLIKEGEAKTFTSLQIQRVDHENSNKYINQLNKKFNHRAEISILSKGEILGLYDIENGMFNNTAVCSSKSLTILKILVQDFNKRMHNQDSLLRINESRLMKESMHRDCISSIAKAIKEKVNSPRRKYVIPEDRFQRESVLATPIASPKGVFRTVDSKNDALFRSINRLKDKIKNCVNSPIRWKRQNSSLSPKERGFLNELGKDRLRYRSDKKMQTPKRYFLEEKEDDVSLSQRAKPHAITPSRIISLLMPFGRLKPIRTQKTTEIINIHTQKKLGRASSRLRSNSIFKFTCATPN